MTREETLKDLFMCFCPLTQIYESHVTKQWVEGKRFVGLDAK